MTKPVKKFTLQVQRVQTMTVEISEDNGYDMPEDIQGVIEMDRDIRDDPAAYFDRHVDWDNGELKLVSLKAE